MNESNYGTLEACKKLVEKGIVLRTEAVWATDGCDWRLMSRNYIGSWLYCIPAPSMAEAWRELPETIEEYDLTCEKIFNGGLQAGYTAYDVSGLRWKVLLNNSNPTDALIDLLIFVKEHKP